MCMDRMAVEVSSQARLGVCGKEPSVYTCTCVCMHCWIWHGHYCECLWPFSEEKRVFICVHGAFGYGVLCDHHAFGYSASTVSAFGICK